MAKTDIITKIREAYSLNPDKTSRAKVEDALYNTSESVLESFYGDTINETNAAQSIFSVASAGLEYGIDIAKTGRRVNLSGTIRNATGSAISTLLNIVDNNYKCTTNKSFYGTAYMSSGEQQLLRVRNLTSGVNQDTLSFVGILLPDESVNFNITYNVQL